MKKRNFFASLSFIAFLTSCIGCASFSDTIYQKTIINSMATTGTTTKAIIFNGNGKGFIHGMSIVCHTDGSCGLFGDTFGSFTGSTDYFAALLSPEQKLVWAKTYGGKNDDGFVQAIHTSDGGYLLMGISNSLLYTPVPGEHGDYPLLIKIDSSGNMQWARAIEYGSPKRYYKQTIAYNVQQTTDKNYILSVKYENNDRSYSNILVKLSAKGDFIWANQFDFGDSLNHKVITFYTESTDDSFYMLYKMKENNFALIRADKNGKPIWAKLYTGENEMEVYSDKLIVNEKGECVVSAVNYLGEHIDNSTIVAILTTPDGNVRWAKQYSANKSQRPWSIIKGNNQDFLIVGFAGENVEKYIYAGTIAGSVPVNAFALLIDMSGNIKSSFLTSKHSIDEFRSASSSQGKYFLWGMKILSEKEGSAMLSIWEPNEKTNSKYLSSVFSQQLFKLKEENIKVDIKPVKIESKEVTKDEIKTNNLKISDSAPTH